jgi:ribosomal protein L19E
VHAGCVQAQALAQVGRVVAAAELQVVRALVEGRDVVVETHRHAHLWGREREREREREIERERETGEREGGEGQKR